jgi:hypothetical protein
VIRNPADGSGLTTREAWDATGWLVPRGAPTRVMDVLEHDGILRRKYERREGAMTTADLLASFGQRNEIYDVGTSRGIGWGPRQDWEGSGRTVRAEEARERELDAAVREGLKRIGVTTEGLRPLGPRAARWLGIPEAGATSAFASNVRQAWRDQHAE